MKRMVLTTILCGMAVLTFAGTRYRWQGGAETHYWSEPGMWITDAEPTGVEGIPNGEDEVRIWGTGTTVITNGDVISTMLASLRYDQVLHMQGGTWNNLGTGDHFFIPWSGGKGTVMVDDGLLNIKGNMQLAWMAGSAGLGMLKQFGGSVVVDKWAVIGRHTSTTGLARHVGGTMSVLSANYGYVIGEQGIGRLDVGGTGTVSVGGNYGLWFYNRAEGASGEAVLGTGGKLTTRRFTVGNSDGYLGTGCTFTFDGGTLKTAEDRAAFITVGGTQTATSLTAFGVTSRGGTVDTDGHAVTFNQALTAADAVAPSNLVHRWSFNGNYTDSVGDRTATPDGSASLSTLPGSVKLPGGAHGTCAVDLGAGLVPTGDAGFTVEVWGTLDVLQSWARCFEIGSKSTSTAGDYFFLWMGENKQSPIWSDLWNILWQRTSAPVYVESVCDGDGIPHCRDGCAGRRWHMESDVLASGGGDGQDREHHYYYGPDWVEPSEPERRPLLAWAESGGGRCRCALLVQRGANLESPAHGMGTCPERLCGA